MIRGVLTREEDREECDGDWIDGDEVRNEVSGPSGRGERDGGPVRICDGPRGLTSVRNKTNIDTIKLIWKKYQ